ncbi:MAG: hypothetical protein U0Y08_12775 [Bacteroidia bacterium]
MKKSILIITLSFIGAAAMAQNNAYGDNQKQVEPGVFAIYSGDINQDGVIDVTDQGILDNDIFNFAVGYLNSDLNGDSLVDVTDQGILDNNIANFIGVISPALGMRIANSGGRNESVNLQSGNN